MKFKIIGRRYDVTDKIRDYVEKKLGKLDKFFKDELTCSVASEIMIILKLQFMRQV